MKLCRAAAADGIHPFPVKCPARSGPAVGPGECDPSSRGFQSVVGLRAELPDLLLAGGDHSQSRRLNAAAGELRIVLAGQSPGGVDADDPVGFCPRDGCMVQVLIIPARAEMGESLADRLVCHGRDPESLDGLFIPCLVQDPAGDKFSFAPGVSGDDDVGHILPKDLLFYSMILLRCLPDDDKLPVFREHGKGVHAPGLVLFSVFLGIGKRHQVPESPGDDIVLSFHINICFLSAAEDAGDIARHRRLFCNHKMLHRCKISCLLFCVIRCGSLFR